jgi:hypothetical protein
MGTESEDFVRLSQRIGRTTGGIRPVTYISAIRGQEQSTAWLILRQIYHCSGWRAAFCFASVLLTMRLDSRTIPPDGAGRKAEDPCCPPGIG